jgi:hypothetical protein
MAVEILRQFHPNLALLALGLALLAQPAGALETPGTGTPADPWRLPDDLDLLPVAAEAWSLPKPPRGHNRPGWDDNSFEDSLQVCAPGLVLTTWSDKGGPALHLFDLARRGPAWEAHVEPWFATVKCDATDVVLGARGVVRTFDARTGKVRSEVLRGDQLESTRNALLREADAAREKAAMGPCGTHRGRTFAMAKDGALFHLPTDPADKRRVCPAVQVAAGVAVLGPVLVAGVAVVWQWPDAGPLKPTP